MAEGDPSAPPGESNPRGEKKLSELLRETWMGALGVLSSAEHEIARATSRLVEILGRPKEEAQHLAQELQGRVRRNRAELERRVEEGVRVAAERLRSPLASEIAALRGRVEKLSVRLEEELRRRRGSS